MKIFPAILLMSLVALSSCGDTGETGSSSDQTTASKAAAPTPAPHKPWAKLKRTAGPHASSLIIPAGPPPKKVVTYDLYTGKGQKLKSRDWFSLRYLSLNYKTGEVRENHWEEPFNWQYGPGDTVKGWEPGLKGMRVGGLRELIVPSSWAYENGALVYLIKLLDVGKQ